MVKGPYINYNRNLGGGGFAICSQHKLQCTEGWECNLGFGGLEIFLPVMVWGASWDPTERYSTMEPSGSTFRGPLKLSKVGLVVRKG